MVTKKTADTQAEDPETAEDQAEITSLPPVKFVPDMSAIFQQAEDYQKNINALAMEVTKNSITELYSVSTPAVELALASLAEAIDLKEGFGDFFKPVTP